MTQRLLTWIKGMADDQRHCAFMQQVKLSTAMRRLALIAIAVMATGAAVLFPAQASDLDSGALYVNNCGPCHGVTGLGGGPVASSFSVLMPQLATLSQRNGGIFPEDYVLRVIDGREPMMAHGTRSMPVWGSILDSRHSGDGEETSTPFVIRSIVDYVKGLQIE